ncbi:MAG: hypothetical protein ABI590_06585 [Ilumatobacteraceae bacterium]
MGQDLSPLIAERISCPLSQWTGEVGRCQWCDEPLSGVRRRTWCSEKCGRAWQREHIWRFARSAAKRKARFRCTRMGCPALRRDCEVNHLEPRNGKGYGPGCHHHLLPDRDGRGGLEVLCHVHHAQLTAAQATARALLRRGAKDSEIDVM